MVTGSAGADRGCSAGTRRPSLAFVLAFLGCITCYAGAGSAADDREPAGEETAAPRHNLNLLVRYTFERAGDGFTTGLEYEYRFLRWLGIGGMAEYVAGDIDVGVVGVMANFHPWADLVLVTGPGLEFNSVEQELLLRVGALYEFKLGPVYLGPAVMVDLIDGEGHALIVGGQAGVKF